ncbi:DMT family transporter [Marinicella gelatinilytica]|uniref:DMT family transporter n=1 Tax=Marinicella gelatinilytica TaxID=2996017 RepID=UPI002260A1E5|nr:SMR family transporter [Marinicella gelatinilytica]MCX7545568.1 SMR family transporter [Marinicella gelatinilytica]
MSINWILLFVGGLFETGFAISVSISMYLLYKAMGGPKAIPVGTAYAVWGAIGAIGTVIAGIIIFKEPVTFWRMFFLSTLIISVIGLQVVSSHS